MSHLIMLIGLPGSGKSTYAEQLQKTIEGAVYYCSSDVVREELYGNAAIQGDPNKVFQVMHHRVVEHLKDNETVIYDATNVTRKNRRGIIQATEKYRDKLTGIIVWAPFEQCVGRDLQRARTVGREVVYKFLCRWQTPYYDEGFDNIYVERNWNINTDTNQYENEMIKWMQVTQHDNPHHNADSIYAHCARTRHNIDPFAAIREPVLSNAARLHDIGKPITKTCTEVNNAHYYSHEHAGGYIVLGFESLSLEIVLLSWLITNHMEPYFESKYWRGLSQNITMSREYRVLCDLHKADVDAY